MPPPAASIYGVLVLAVGGYIGGTIVFVYGNRVLKQPDTPVTDALVPGRADPSRPPVTRSRRSAG